MDVPRVLSEGKGEGLEFRGRTRKNCDGVRLYTSTRTCVYSLFCTRVLVSMHFGVYMCLVRVSTCALVLIVGPTEGSPGGSKCRVEG